MAELVAITTIHNDHVVINLDQVISIQQADQISLIRMVNGDGYEVRTAPTEIALLYRLNP